MSTAADQPAPPPVAVAPSRLLLIEDDTAVREAVSVSFEGFGFTVLAVATGERFPDVIHEFRPDVAVVDIQLPSGPNGFDLARQLIALAGTPVVFLTAADSIEDRLSGFEAGGDDYVVKPFAMSELLARVRAVLRRSGRLQSPVVEIRDLMLDDSAKEAFRAGVPLNLTPTEFELLSVLTRSPNRVFSKGQLLSRVWGFDSYDPNLVEVYISVLRRKLEVHGPRVLFTIRGQGYVFRS